MDKIEFFNAAPLTAIYPLPIPKPLTVAKIVLIIGFPISAAISP